MLITILVLASLGILDSGYLSYVHLFGVQACGQWAGCSFVLSSPYSRILGVPLPAIGLGVYICLTFLALHARDTQKKDDATRWIFYITSAGILLAGYLVFLQALIIQHWCPFCLLSTALMLIIFVLVLWYRIVNKEIMFLLKFPNWKFGLKPMLGFMILPTIIFLGIEQAIGFFSTASIIPDHNIIARMGERTVTLGEIDYAIRIPLNQIEWKRYEVRLLWLENELLSMEADKQGVSVKQLVKKNINDVVSVSEDEIKKIYDDNRKGFIKAVTFEKVRKRLENTLKNEKLRIKRNEYLSLLKENYNANFLLPEPSSVALDNNPRQGPEKGPTDAALTVIIISDFECPFCKKAHQQMKDLQSRYPQDIRLLFRHFPSPTHKNAHTASYAAVCAHLQGKFWPYADMLFENQSQLGASKLNDYATQTGLDIDTFKQCLESEQTKEIVDADVSELLDMGIANTPGFFFNGHYIRGVPNPRQIQLILDMFIPEHKELGAKPKS